MARRPDALHRPRGRIARDRSESPWLRRHETLDAACIAAPRAARGEQYAAPLAILNARPRTEGRRA